MENILDAAASIGGLIRELTEDEILLVTGGGTKTPPLAADPGANTDGDG